MVLPNDIAEKKKAEIPKNVTAGHISEAMNFLQLTVATSITANSQATNPSSSVANLGATNATENTKKKRNQFSHSKRRLLANYTFWLDNKYLVLFNKKNCIDDQLASLTKKFVLQGQIVQCPSQTNGNQYVISWNIPSEIPSKWAFRRQTI